ncbi:MAG: hypothetical protein JWR10_4750 [Rubritepida sp.]|nr:hypothetical protein [Rubritepida sp.]
MNRSSSLMCLALGVLAGSWGLYPSAAQAQLDARTQQLIDQLRPRSQQNVPSRTRGITMPMQSDPGASQPPAASPVASAAPVRRAPSGPATTTAPAGTPAVSLVINFQSGSAVLAPSAVETLDRLGRALGAAEFAGFRFRIEGHTDSVGPAEGNLALSERRAEAVKDYLVKTVGLDAARLVTQGLGESQPLIRTPDETAEVRNRRVQVLNLGS